MAMVMMLSCSHTKNHQQMKFKYITSIDTREVEVKVSNLQMTRSDSVARTGPSKPKVAQIRLPCFDKRPSVFKKKPLARS